MLGNPKPVRKAAVELLHDIVVVERLHKIHIDVAVVVVEALTRNVVVEVALGAQLEAFVDSDPTV